jgi:hypothetical protein
MATKDRTHLLKPQQIVRIVDLERAISGTDVKTLREWLGLSQSALCDWAEFTHKKHYQSFLEKDEKPVSIDLKLRLAKIGALRLLNRALAA